MEKNFIWNKQEKNLVVCMCSDSTKSAPSKSSTLATNPGRQIHSTQHCLDGFPVYTPMHMQQEISGKCHNSLRYLEIQRLVEYQYRR